MRGVYGKARQAIVGANSPNKADLSVPIILVAATGALLVAVLRDEMKLGKGR